MLDRPFGRPILSIAGSLYRTVAFRRLAFAWYKNAQWINKEPEGYLVERQIMLHPLEDFHRISTDTYLYTYRLRPGDIVIDCGAYTGWEALLFSRLVGSAGRVVAIEAHPVSYGCLVEMCRRNHLSNVALVQCAAWDLAGTIQLTDTAGHQANTIVAGETGIAVEARTLDEIVQQLGLKRVDFISMNIEGAEAAAFRGATKTLGITQHIAVSCHDWFVGVWGPAMRTKAEVRRLLEDAGFKITTRPDDPRPWIQDFLYADRV